jgi:hypothetical protein
MLNRNIWSSPWQPQYKVGGKKWFYINDRKVAPSDQYGIAPFDASKEVKKLTSWDSPPTEA